MAWCWIKCKETFAFTFLRLVDFGPDISSRTKEIRKIIIREDRKDIPEGRKVFRHVKVSGRGTKEERSCYFVLLAIELWKLLIVLVTYISGCPHCIDIVNRHAVHIVQIEVINVLCKLYWLSGRGIYVALCLDYVRNSFRYVCYSQCITWIRVENRLLYLRYAGWVRRKRQYFGKW